MIVGFLYLSVSITCSILVSIILRKNIYKKINLSDVVFINYATATIISLFFFKTNTKHLISVINNNLYIILMIGFLLPIGFISMAQSIRYFGVTKSEIFQRMSIVIPIIASFTIFNDDLSTIKIIYIIIAIFSIFCLLDKQQEYKIIDEKKFYQFKWPMLVCFTYGLADILFKKISSNNVFTSCLCLSFLIASFVMAIYITFTKQFFFSKNNIINGILFGTLNWVNISSYIKAHKYLYDMPSTVFVVMNLGVIISGTIVGTVFFKEKLNKNNILGIFIAILSIIIAIIIR
ncbi:hypothetical protein CONE_0328 [Candidatus Kinetoplastibacterium oncopeltii TCC290E]|uniref:EamA domain-containing protein n=1 Tax=Candidatus Kinetoplastidibacterium stringomonadis TCC290E TaxID=1208920 RepID=M1LRE3_9PROT|nr:EamA family transporter [Candidatus Kinetoplastibacterium oncopeltii]AGF48137.1 hypothetical protein CONE_0328 [Candidatus Kinetoplastibacterium oncopeltii TCC290E]